MAANRPTQVTQQEADEALCVLADYAYGYKPDSEEAYATAAAGLADSLGCAMLALNFPQCTKLLGPVVPGATLKNGTRIPGTSFSLDPVTGAFNIGTMIRWLDFNDAWLAAEWGHPSDNLGGILALADYLCRNGRSLAVRDVLTAMIKAHEIQGGLALENSFNRVGFDHVILVKVATTAVATQMLGGTRGQIIDALSNAWIDAGSLRTYRHAPNTGSRKSWAAGDATARGVQLALLTLRGEMGYPKALTAKQWGVHDVLLRGKPLRFQRPLGSYVMENILFKVAFPAEFHAQTAVECAVQLYPKVKGRWDEIDRISVETHESALRIIDKTGPLKNPADRDHCLQYMTAVALLHGTLTADDYEDDAARDPRIDRLREKMVLTENPQYSVDYLDPDKRSIPNAVTVHFFDGSKIGPVEVKYPLGHRRRRKEGLPLLFEKCERNLMTRFDKKNVERILALFRDQDELQQMPISDFIDLFFLEKEK